MKRLLFVDDEPRVLEALKVGLYLRRKEWDMQFAGGGAQAMELMKQEHFDVLVTDLRMPGVDGTALVACAKADTPDTIRIVLSGYANEEQSHRLVSLAHRYLSKPCESARLEECIDRCLVTQSLIQSDELRNQLGSIGALPPMPQTFAALQGALADPNVDSTKVAAIIQRDPAVSAKVLQVCNSAFFRLPRRVVNIQQAVSYLGLSTVRSLVLSTELFTPASALPAGLDLGLLQRHAFRVAGIARFLAAEAPWTEDAFLAGLLHDVGLLLFGRQGGGRLQSALDAAAAGVTFAEAERTCIGVDHGTGGAYLLGIWGLPFEVVEAVAHHESPGQFGQSEFDVLGAVSVAHELLIQVSPADVPPYEKGPPNLGDEYLRRVHYPRTWDFLLQKTQEMLHSEAA